MSIRIVRLGSARAPDEGPRIGTVRRPPRGVPKNDFARGNYYDVWLPMLSPSAELVAQARLAQTPAEWKLFVKKYRTEMNDPDCARLLDLLALLSKTTNFAVGCYCDDETRCHRSALREMLIERGAAVR